MLASLIWIPEDYMRFCSNIRTPSITGGPFADEVEPTVDATRSTSAEYGVDVFMTRAQIDF